MSSPDKIISTLYIVFCHMKSLNWLYCRFIFINEAPEKPLFFDSLLSQWILRLLPQQAIMPVWPQLHLIFTDCNVLCLDRGYHIWYLVLWSVQTTIVNTSETLCSNYFQFLFLVWQWSIVFISQDNKSCFLFFKPLFNLWNDRPTPNHYSYTVSALWNQAATTALN